MISININISDNYYVKDPQSSDLGKNIINGSIELLDELGFEQFTFKKLADHINSTEASIYRYFDNKLRLLVYLTTWYWAWIEYQIDYRTHHLEDSYAKLNNILKVICNTGQNDFNLDLPGIDTTALRRVVVSEADKTYLTKQVDEINKEGLFMVFKGLTHKIALIISEIDPKYPYPHSTVSTMIEASHQQAFFAQHLPSLTDMKEEDKCSVEVQVYNFLDFTLKKLLSKKH